MNPQEKNRIRNYLIRRVDYPTLMSIIDQNYRYVENEFDPDYDFHNFNYGLATIIVEDLHIMDHIDLHIEHMYNDLIDYFYDTLKNRTRKLYDKLTNNTNLQEQIRSVLKEETSLQKKLMGLFKNQGIEPAIVAVGGFDNFSKILNLDLDDIKTQEMLVKNFIYHTKLVGIDILHLEIDRNKPDKVRIKIHFDTNLYASNVESWVTRAMSEKINKFFPFKATPYWEPVFASRGVTIILDSEQIVSEDEEDEMNLQETELTEKCWKGYTQKGMKTMFGKRYPNCVKKKK
jgi:hypothetical protein